MGTREPPGFRQEVILSPHETGSVLIRAALVAGDHSKQCCSSLQFEGVYVLVFGDTMTRKGSEFRRTLGIAGGLGE